MKTGEQRMRMAVVNSTVQYIHFLHPRSHYARPVFSFFSTFSALRDLLRNPIIVNVLFMNLRERGTDDLVHLSTYILSSCDVVTVHAFVHIGPFIFSFAINIHSVKKPFCHDLNRPRTVACTTRHPLMDMYVAVIRICDSRDAMSQHSNCVVELQKTALL